MEEHKLKLHDVIVTTLTAVIGGGIFIMSVDSQKQAYVGSSMFISYLIGAVLAMILALIYSQLSSIFPKTGGDYIYVSRLLNPYVGFIVSWLRWMGSITGISFLTFHTIGLINDLISINDNYVGNSKNIILEAVILIVLLLYINLRGLKIYNIFQSVLNYVMLLGIFVFVVYGIYKFDFEVFRAGLVFDWRRILLSTSIVFWAYTGFQTVTYLGDEVEEGEKNISKGILISLALITLIYVAMSGLIYGFVDSESVLNYNSIPSLLKNYNPYVYYIVIVAAIMALLGGISPSILSSSRLLYAWSMDKILPSFFGKKDKKGTPFVSLMIVVFVTIILMIFGRSDVVIAFSSLSLLMSYFLASLSSFVMRFNHKDLYMHSIFGFKGMYIISFMGVVITGLFIYTLLSSSKDMYLFSITWLSLGTILYLWRYEKHKVHELVEKEMEILKKKVLLKKGLLRSFGFFRNI